MRMRARIEDVDRLAMAMPHVTVVRGRHGNPVYQVGGKSFIFFRTPRPDAVDPDSGTTPHFDGHPSVLLRGSHVDRLDRGELAELVQDAWLARASQRRATAWLRSHGLE